MRLDGRNEVWLHRENGITRMTINGVDVSSVKDYQIKSSANGETELTITISAMSVITDFETSLTGIQQQHQ